MLNTDRVYSLINLNTGCIEWYFSAREGQMGPYPTEAMARASLEEFVRRCIAAGDDGGRGKAVALHRNPWATAHRTAIKTTKWP